MADKITSLASAIRVGSAMTPESIKFYDPHTGGCCALGAAAIATGYQLEAGKGHEIYEYLHRRFPKVEMMDILFVSARHAMGQMTRLELARWCEYRQL